MSVKTTNFEENTGMCEGVKRDSEKAITQIVLRALAQRSSPSNSSHFLEGQQAI